VAQAHDRNRGQRLIWARSKRLRVLLIDERDEGIIGHVLVVLRDICLGGQVARSK
jgi:hypothetical protein